MTIKDKIFLIRYLLYFQAVVRNGQINATAERNGIKASNLSKIIKDFEQYVGGQLLERNSEGVKPTIKGMKYYSISRELEQYMQRLFSLMNQESIPNTDLAIYIPPNVRIPELSKFVQQYPQINIIPISYPDTADVAISYEEPTNTEKMIITRNTIGKQFSQEIWISCIEDSPPAILLAEFIISALHL